MYIRKGNFWGNANQYPWEDCPRILAGNPSSFSNIDNEPFVIMPNHIHGIITIHENDCRGTIYRAPTIEKFGKPVVGSIPTIIRTYKATVSRLAKREIGMVKIWQRNYYEHIICDQTEMKHIVDYILANPIHWSDDPENRS
jgi:putative transposase